MSETTSHKQAKGKAAGRKGETEVAIPRNKRIDAKRKGVVTEVERSGDLEKLKQATLRLKAFKNLKKVLQVPQSDMSKAVQAMKSEKVHGSVKNMGGTKRQSV